jgi:hypothetical protein
MRHNAAAEIVERHARNAKGGAGDVRFSFNSRSYESIPQEFPPSTNLREGFVWSTHGLINLMKKRRQSHAPHSRIGGDLLSLLFDLVGVEWARK